MLCVDSYTWMLRCRELPCGFAGRNSFHASAVWRHSGSRPQNCGVTFKPGGCAT